MGKTRPEDGANDDYETTEACMPVKNDAEIDGKAEWMQEREVGEEKPILACGLIVFPILFALAFFFGSDIASLSVVFQHSCDCKFITDTTEEFENVDCSWASTWEYFVLGVLWHWVFLGSFSFIIYHENMNELDTCSSGCILCLVVTWGIWIGLGFNLYTEMNVDNVDDYQQCSDTLISWTVIKLIEFVIVPGFYLIVTFIAKKFDVDDKDFKKYAAKMACGICGVLFAMAFLWVPDIAVLSVPSGPDATDNWSDRCDDAISGSPQYMRPDVWTYIGGFMHIFITVFFACVAYCAGGEIGDGQYWKCLCVFGVQIFFIIWSVYGILIYQEMDEITAQNYQMCREVILSWSIIRLIEFVVIPICVICVMTTQ